MNSQHQLLIAIRTCDTFAANARNLLAHESFEDASKWIEMAEDQLEGLEANLLVVLMRKAMIARIKASIAFKQDRLEEAALRFKEVISMAEIVSDLILIFFNKVINY